MALIDIAPFLTEEYISKISSLYPDIEEKYKENPYFLLDIIIDNEDITVPTFIDIDKNTILKTFELRLIEMKYACKTVLLENEQKGNSWMPLNSFYKKVTKLLNKTKHPLLKGTIRPYLNYYNNDFVIEKNTISLYETRWKEFCIYNGIKSAKKNSQDFSKYKPIDNTNILSDIQMKSAENIVKYGGNISLLTGGPGTGKTTVLKAIVTGINEYYPEKKIALLAPTGKAANRIQEVFNYQDIDISTIHLYVGWEYPSFKMKKIKANIAKTDIIFVDEASMPNVEVLSKLFELVNLSTTKIIFIGDPNQLPAIGTGDIINDLRRMNVYEEHLSINYRSRLAINKNATALLMGDNNIETDETFNFINICDENNLESLEEIMASSDENTILLTPYRKEKLIGNVIKMNKNIHNKKYGELRHDFINGWCIGDRVILKKTNYKRKYFNGDTGILTGYKANVVTENRVKTDAYIVTLYNGKKVFVTDDSNIELAYAITINKSQGSEYNEVNIYIPKYSTFITKKMLYTAITRAKNKVNLYTTKEIYNLVCSFKEKQRKTMISLWI